MYGKFCVLLVIPALSGQEIFIVLPTFHKILLYYSSVFYKMEMTV